MTMNNLTARNFVYPVAFAIVWMIMTGYVEPISFIIGYALSFVVIWLLLSAQEDLPQSRTENLPIRIVMITWYIIRLNYAIFLSGTDVVLRILGIRKNKIGIVAVPVQDPDDNQVVAGLSAHSITITPGQLVVAYNPEGTTLYVHCLDVDKMAPTLNAEQAERVAEFRRMLGLD